MIRSKYYVLLLLFFLSSSIKNFGQTTVLTSIVPSSNNSFTEADMLHINGSDLLKLDRSAYLEPKKHGKNGGIIAQVNHGGEVRLKVFAYDPSKADRKGVLLYGCYIDRSSDDYVEKIWTENFDYKYSIVTGNWGNITESKTFFTSYKSNNIKQALQLFGHICDVYESNIDKFLNFFTIFYHAPQVDDSNFRSLECNGQSLNGIKAPVIAELTITNATFKKCFIPGIGVITHDEFLANDLKNSIVQIKGSNYEINPLNTGVSFGHNDNRYTIATRINLLASTKLTGLYDSVNDGDGLLPHSYFKVKVPENGIFYFAMKSSNDPLQPPGGTLTYPYPPEFGPALLIFSQAFSIEDKNNNITYFDVYRSTKTPNSIVKFSASEAGPFIIAGNFDVSFKEDLTLPATKRKLFHRADWLNDVLVCAHRGIWTKTGSHNPVDYSGIAENTIPAYELAINNPSVDWIEFDARRTSDGVFVAWHDEGISRVSSFPDDQECIPIDEVNARDKLWKDAHQPDYSQGNIAINNKTWSFMNQLHVRDYLGCKVKDNQGNYLHPLKLEEGFQWLVNQKSQGKHSIISVDYKDGKYHLDELYELILKYDLEGQVLLSVYAKEYSLSDYQAEYGKDFLKQIPLKPTFYEPVKPTDYGGNVLNRFNEYVNAEGHFVAGFTLNVNYDQDNLLIAVLEQPTFPAIANRMWYMTHYVEPFMASINDNNRITTPVDCDPAQHPAFQTCANLFWRADFDWTLNNGTNALFSDNTEALIEYLKAKGKK